MFPPQLASRPSVARTAVRAATISARADVIGSSRRVTYRLPSAGIEAAFGAWCWIVSSAAKDQDESVMKSSIVAGAKSSSVHRLKIDARQPSDGVFNCAVVVSHH